MLAQKSIVIGARRSRLSLIQARTVADLLVHVYPNVELVIREFTTQGDRLLDTPLPLLGGKGVFTQEIEASLLTGEIDLAVHSLKDLPVSGTNGLLIGAVPERASVEDVLVSRDVHNLATLPTGARVGTSSPRRSAQLLLVRPDLKPVSIRGNVETRIRKLRDPAEGFDAIVLAKSGLERLDRLDVVSEVLSLDVMLPAPGQGALAVQCRDNEASIELAASINHRPTELATIAERSFLSALGGGCSAPVGAYGSFDGHELVLRGRIIAPAGSSAVEVESTDWCRTPAESEEIGAELAKLTIARGGASLLRVPV